jgi:6-pyruvoyl-tetrahydropterin synthase
MNDLDHICLNVRPPFLETNPTAENIAEYIFDCIKVYVHEDARITQVKVWEGPKNYASFFPDE